MRLLPTLIACLFAMAGRTGIAQAGDKHLFCVHGCCGQGHTLFRLADEKHVKLWKAPLLNWTRGE